MTTKQLQLWVGWILANAAGLAVSGLVWLLISSAQEALSAWLGVHGGSVLLLLALLVWPLGSAVAQWLLLRSYLRNLEMSWLPATLVGGIVVPGAISLGFVVSAAAGGLFNAVPTALGWGIAGVAAGSAVGVTQGGVLRKALGTDTALWVLANAAGWGVGWCTAALAGQLVGNINAWLPMHLNFAAETAYFSFIVGHVESAALTGFALVYLLRSRLEET